MRFGSLFRSCPSRHARALPAPSRVHVNGCNRPLLLHAPGAAIATSISVHLRPSAALLPHAPGAPLWERPYRKGKGGGSTFNFRLPTLQFQISNLLSIFRMNTYIKFACNQPRMNTYKIIGLKVPLESTLTKKGGGGGGLLLSAFCLS